MARDTYATVSSRYRMRSVAEIASGRIGALPETYRGIPMRSRLEVDFAIYLDGLGVEWRYEPCVFGEPGEGYLPDFELTTPERLVFVEVKPTIAEARTARHRMTVIWDTQPDALLIVASGEECRFFGRLPGRGWTSWQERWAH